MPASTGAALIRPGRQEDAFGLAETAIAAWRVGFRGIVPEQVDPAATWRPKVLLRLRARSQTNRSTASMPFHMFLRSTPGTKSSITVRLPRSKKGMPKSSTVSIRKIASVNRSSA